MFKSILRFVKSAHFFVIAFACIFGVFATTNAFAVYCIDRSSGSSRTAGTNEYVGPSNYCSYCGSQDGLSSGTQFSSGVLAFTSSCGNGAITCRNDAYKAQYNSYVYYCFPCPGGSKITGDPNIPSMDNVTWSTGGKCQFTYNRGDDANGCTYHSQWNVSTTENSGNDYCQGIGSTPSRPETMVNYYTMQHGSTNSCKYSHKYQYTAASAGYHLSSDKASCVACGTHEYSPAGNALTACYPCPYGGGTWWPRDYGLQDSTGIDMLAGGLNENSSGIFETATQGTGVGDTCVISNSTGSDDTGTYNNGACSYQPRDDYYSYGMGVSFKGTNQASDWGQFKQTVCQTYYAGNNTMIGRCQNGYYGFGDLAVALSAMSNCEVYDVDNDNGKFDMTCPTLYHTQSFLNGLYYDVLDWIYFD